MKQHLQIIVVMLVSYSEHLVRSSPFITDTLSIAGTHVDAPKYKSVNNTWQIGIQLSIPPETKIIPFFFNLGRDSTRDDEIIDQCTGFHDTCCLYEMDNVFVNHELHAFFQAEPLCTSSIQSKHTDEFLQSLPFQEAFVQYALAGETTLIGRSWFTSIQQNPTANSIYNIIYEFPQPVITSDNVSSVLEMNNPVIGDVIDFRQMRVLFMALKGLDVPIMQYMPSVHVLEFAIIRDEIARENAQHNSFTFTCNQYEKPKDTFWITQNTAGSIKCVWMCPPHHIEQPPRAHTTNQSLATCVHEPQYGGILEINMMIQIPDAALWDTERTQFDEYLILALRNTLAHILQIEQKYVLSYWHDTSYKPYTINPAQNWTNIPSIPIQKATFAVAIFTSDYTRNASTQLETAYHKIKQTIFMQTMGTYLQEIIPSTQQPMLNWNIIQQILTSDKCRVQIIDGRAIVRSPPQPPLPVPIRDILILSIWLSVIVIFCCYSMILVYSRIKPKTISHQHIKTFHVKGIQKQRLQTIAE